MISTQVINKAKDRTKNRFKKSLQTKNTRIIKVSNLIKTSKSFLKTYTQFNPSLTKHLTEGPLLSLTSFVPLDKNFKFKVNDRRRIVIFIHGFAGHKSNFFPMKKYFYYKGRKRTISISFNKSNSIEAMAKELDEVLKKIRVVNSLSDNAPVFDIVAHSMGGLIIRLALEYGNLRKSIKNIITLGTPHSGTNLANLINLEKIEQLRPESDLMKRLNQQIPWKNNFKGPDLYSMWSKKDIILMPADSAIVDGAENIEMKNYSHYSFLLYPKSWNKILSIINRNSIITY